MALMTKPLLESESTLVIIIEDWLFSEGPAGRVIDTQTTFLCRLLLNIEYHSFSTEEIRSLK